MSKFVFRLASLHRLRESVRDERRAALTEAYRVEDVLVRQLDRLELELRSLRTLCRDAAGPGSVNVDRLVEAQRYELVTKTQQAQLLRQRETVAAEIQRRRNALIEADRDVRILEKLRERQAEEHRVAEERVESKRLDEVAIMQAAREAMQ